ncbi:MAG: helix-turn-helix transcriptional regulator [Deltaproteobacteria bacterium]|nr:helix-turn-helix transcriptional regulator [Deltaproteobacteria bacterium]
MEEESRKRFMNADFFEDLTGEIPSVPEKDVEDIGQRFRKIREEKGLSLEELSRLTGFDVSFLSSLERNEAQPQLGTVIKLSKALDSAFGRLVSGVGDKLYSITRKDERRTVSRSTSRTGKKQVYTYKSLAPDVKGRHMEALIVQLEEISEKEISIHEGEEFIFVLEGVVLLEIGDESFELEPGDTAYYLSTTPHHVAAKKGKATILAVLYEG